MLNKCDPLVFIVVPVFNRPDKIKRSVKSIQNQSYKNWNLLIVNDNSTDGTGLVIESFVISDTRISTKLNKEYSRGPAGARNSGLESVAENAAYIAFLDSDDEWTEDYLENALQTFKRNPHLGLVVSDLSRINEQKTVLIRSKFIDEKGIPDVTSLTSIEGGLELIYNEKTLRRAIKERFTVGLHSTVFKRQIWNERKLPDARIAEDHLFTLDLVREKTPIAFISSIGLLYYIHDSNISSVNSKQDFFKQYRNVLCEARLLKRFIIANQSLTQEEKSEVYARIGNLFFWHAGYYYLTKLKRLRRAEYSLRLGIKYARLGNLKITNEMWSAILKLKIKRLIFR